VTAGDDAERSDDEERRYGRAGDDAERSDDEERRYGRAGGEGDEAMMRSGAADGIRKT
jgi:segregation and condensation protein B